MSNSTSTRQPNAWWVGVVCGMASYLDSAAIVGLSIVAAIYSAVYGFTPGEVGIAMAALTFGVAVGALVGGRLGDTFGRRPVFTVTMIVTIVGSVVAFTATGFPMYAVGAALVGLGTGADLPVSLSTISEAANDRNRGRLITLSNLLWIVGIIGALALGTAFGNLGIVGAQILIAHVGIVAVLVLIGRLTIPESDLWLAARAERSGGVRTVRAERGNLATLLKSPYVVPFLALIVFYALVNLALSTGGQFNTYLLTTIGNTDVSTASSLGLISLPVLLVGYALFMRVADSKHRFAFFTAGGIMFLVSLLIIPIFGFSVTTFIATMVLLSLGTAFSGETIMKVWSQESFPTLLRATAQGTIIAVARFAAGALATVTPLILAGAGVGPLYLILAAVGAVGLVVAWVAFRKRDRHSEFETEAQLDDASRSHVAEQVV